LKTADSLVLRSRQSGYGNTLALEDYVWGSNSLAANQSMLLLVALHFSTNAELLNAALANLHYLLGRNCFGVSWVTHVGTHPFMHPHHRPSAADKIEAPWPGLLSGGPNAHPGDPVAHQLPRLPPMRMWVDHEGAYSMNEVAINWNAPLVFALAGAESLAP
jgi:endoglucanase